MTSLESNGVDLNYSMCICAPHEERAVHKKNNNSLLRSTDPLKKKKKVALGSCHGQVVE